MTSINMKNRNKQLNLTDFNQPMELKLDPENKWNKKAELIPWNKIGDTCGLDIDETIKTKISSNIENTL